MEEMNVELTVNEATMMMDAINLYISQTYDEGKVKELGKIIDKLYDAIHTATLIF